MNPSLSRNVRFLGAAIAILGLIGVIVAVAGAVLGFTTVPRALVPGAPVAVLTGMVLILIANRRRP